MAGKEDGFVNSIVGEGARFIGDIELDGLLRIDGDYAGAIKKADRVLISKTGRAKSAIKARVVVIGGALIGDVVAKERLTILSTAIVIGNIKAPLISMEKGVIFHGLCEVAAKELEHENDYLSKTKTFAVEWQDNKEKS
jgi:cytoskeletal protein CcmA (bactofilin family)